MMANAAGPLMAVYFLAMRLDRHKFVGTSAWFFFIVNCLKFPFMAHNGMITPASLGVNLLLLPAVALGAGALALRRIPQRLFEMLVKILAFASAAWLVLEPLLRGG